MIQKKARTLGRTGQGTLKVLKTRNQNTTEKGQLGRDEAEPAVVPLHPVVRSHECCAGLWGPDWSGMGSLATFMLQPLLMFPCL